MNQGRPTDRVLLRRAYSRAYYAKNKERILAQANARNNKGKVSEVAITPRLAVTQALLASMKQKRDKLNLAIPVVEKLQEILAEI